MAEQTQAAPSPADQDVFGGQDNISFDEFVRHRQTGEPSTRVDNAGSAPADTPEKTASEDAADSAATTQEQEQREKSKRRPDVEERFKKLTDEKNARITQLERELEAHRAKSTQADSSPAKPEQTAPPQTYQDWRKVFDADAWEAKYIDAHPEVKYAEVHAAMADHLADVRDHFRSREQAAQAASKEIAEKTEQVRSRYGEEFETILEPTAATLMGDNAIPPDVKRMISLSDVLPELLHAVGSDPRKMETLTHLAKTDPLRAYRYIATLEAGLKSDTSKDDGESAPRNDKGQFVKADTPAKQTSAPKPPEPVGGATTRAFDVSDESLSADEWARKRNAAEFKKRGKL